MPGGKHSSTGAVRPKRYNKRFKLSELTPVPSVGQQEIEDDSSEIEQNQTIEADFEEADTHNADTVSSTQNEHFNGMDQELKIETSNEDESSSINQNVLTNDFKETLKHLLEDVAANHKTYDEEEETSEPEEESYDEAFSSDSDDGANDDGEQNTEKSVPGDQPIYRGHSMTIDVSLLLILLYTMTHGISGSQLNDLLVLIGLHCMEVHPGLKSLFHFKQYFARLKSPLVKHFYCIHCLTCIDVNEEICPNNFCQKNVKDAKAKSYFLEVPIEAQLENFFKRPNFTELLTHRFRKRKQNNSNIEDIYDGELYKRLSVKGGVLSDSYPNNISFTLNTDGVPLFKSSKFSIWPVYLMINELPFKHRKRSENMIFCGLWFGDSKPFMATFSRPIHNSLKTLEEEGITVTVNNSPVICRAFLMCTTADLPAKSILMNMTQFNGAFSCSKCCERGETFKTSNGGIVHIYPFNRDMPFGQERTTESCHVAAIESMNSGKTVNGIKGPSFLMTLKYFDFVKGAGIDYMHGVLLGVTKLLIKLWFSSTFSKEEFSISKSAEIVDKRLLQIKPPSFVTRIPRAISTHFKYWKASELRSWLFYYSLPILRDLLSESYFIHYAAFVEAIYLLCGNSITPQAVLRANTLLMYFVMTLNTLYGDRYQTLNVHQLLHLPECVRQLGPLWAYSCFYFETANGDLTKLFHGTQNVELQILSSANILQNLPSLTYNVPQEYRSIMQKLFDKRLHQHVYTFHLQFLGKGYNKLLSDEVINQIVTLLKYEVPNLTFYSRVILRGQLFHSKDYSRVHKRNSFTVKYFCQKSNSIKFGYIQCFVHHTGTNTENTFALVHSSETKMPITNNLLIPNELKIVVPHIHRVKFTGNKTDVIEINHLIEVCVNVSVQSLNEQLTYICESPNHVETD